MQKGPSVQPPVQYVHQLARDLGLDPQSIPVGCDNAMAIYGYVWLYICQWFLILFPLLEVSTHDDEQHQY
jgi:hypothetical protein